MTGLSSNQQKLISWSRAARPGKKASWTGMGLLTIIKKVKRKEKEMRFLMV